MVLLLHTCSHSPPILYLLTQEWFCFPFPAMPHGICQLSQRLWRPWQSSRCLCAVMMEDEDLCSSSWWASGRPLKSLRCQVVAEWRGERHRAPLVQESCSRPALQPKAVHILIHLTYTLTYFTTILQINMHVHKKIQMSYLEKLPWVNQCSWNALNPASTLHMCWFT